MRVEFSKARLLGIFQAMIRKTTYTRKLDCLGRLSLPSKLRIQLSINEGDVMPFYVYKDSETGKIFLCMECEKALPQMLPQIELAE